MRPARGGENPGLPSAIPRTHSAPARVLPAPRPPSISQAVQSPGGGNWSGRAQVTQSSMIRRMSVRRRKAISASESVLFAQAIKAARKSCAELVKIGDVSIRALVPARRRAPRPPAARRACSSSYFASSLSVRTRLARLRETLSMSAARPAAARVAHRGLGGGDLRVDPQAQRDDQALPSSRFGPPPPIPRRMAAQGGVADPAKRRDALLAERAALIEPPRLSDDVLGNGATLRHLSDSTSARTAWRPPPTQLWSMGETYPRSVTLSMLFFLVRNFMKYQRARRLLPPATASAEAQGSPDRSTLRSASQTNQAGGWLPPIWRHGSSHCADDDDRAPGKDCNFPERRSDPTSGRQGAPRMRRSVKLIELHRARP